MKKNIIALAVAAAVSAPIAAQAAPTVYGQMNMAVQNNKAGDKTGTTVDSVASRLGVKGSADLGKGLKAVYKVEFGLAVDGSAGTSKGGVKGRNQYVGLAGGFGVVLAGRHDTPLKMSQPKDLFNDGALDNGKMTNIGFGASNDNGGEDRVAQTVAYVSPTFSNTKIVLALVPNEGLGEDSAITNIYSVAIMHGSKKKGLYLAAAMNAADSDSGDQNYTRLSAQYAVAGLVANAMYQISDAETAEGNNITIGLAYKMGKMMPKLKYSMDSEDKDSGKEGTVLGLGLDYKMGKKTTAYVEVGMFDEDFSGDDQDRTSVAVGLLHKF